jgi:hypothetical protein
LTRFRLAPPLIAAVALLMLAAPAASAQSVPRCDPLDQAVCLQPWPNDYFTVADPMTDTGKRLNLDVLAMPRSRQNSPIQPTEWNRNDGFSPGQKIVTKVPGLDTPQAFSKTKAVPITDIERTYEPNQAIVVLDADTLERHLIWSEIDANPADPADVNLIIRPAVNFQEGHHYIVALRNLRNAAGKTIKAQQGFRIYRDRRKSTDPEVIARRPHMERIFRTLAQAGIQRNEQLFLAWDFTVASKRNLSERALFMRDSAFAELGDTNLADLTVQGNAPQFLVTQVTDFTPAEDSRIAREVQGNFIVPCYLNANGCPPGSRMSYLPGSNVPQRIPGNTMAANFICRIPRVAVDGPQVIPARPSLYGHGLLGSADEVGGGNVAAMGNEHNFVFCATDWIGMSTTDVPNVVSILQELSNFPSLPDRAQQGFLNFMYLGRLMLHPLGLNSDAAFQYQKGGQTQFVLDTDSQRLFYDGNSQGGIMGGGLTALAPDYERAVLGVPAMNYSTLLRRSVDFDMYAEGNIEGFSTDVGLYDNYPNELERPLILSLIQILWDRGEANGYAWHMTDDPYDNTPAHKVLLHEAFGDHQVANVATEVEARTIGASIRSPMLDPGRHSDVNPFYGIPRISSFPFNGSAYVVWDSGTPTPPTANVPPRPPTYGGDPHSHPRNTAIARLQKSEFLKVNGSVIDTCGPTPCYANGYTPPP